MPGSEIQAKIVQSSAGFHEAVAEVVFSGTHLIFHNSIPLDAANGMFHTYAQDRDRAVEFFWSGESSFLRGFFIGWIVVTPDKV